MIIIIIRYEEDCKYELDISLECNWSDANAAQTHGDDAQNNIHRRDEPEGKKV